MRYYRHTKYNQVGYFLSKYKWFLLGGILIVIFTYFLLLGFTSFEKKETQRLLSDERLDAYSRLPSNNDFIYPYLSNGFLPRYISELGEDNEIPLEKLLENWKNDDLLFERLHEDNKQKLNNFWKDIP